MSYSRWSNSYWYTFWQTQDEATENYDSAVFCICRFEEDITFKAKTLREQLDRCVDTVRLKDRYASEEELEELASYMTNFLEDVDEVYL
jgi:hypothetical protein